MVPITLKTRKQIKINDINEIKQPIYLYSILIAVLLSLLIHTASAGYDFEGEPYNDKFNETTNGSIRGSVYIDGGDGIGNARNSPYYTKSFSVPEGDIIFSRLYVGVWGGTESKTGTLQTTFNDHEFDTLDLEGKKDTNPEVYCSGHGVYWVAYNTMEYTTSGSNTAVARTSGDIDGRVYGIVLVAVCRDKDGDDIEYWVNEGNPNLHSLGWAGDNLMENNEAEVDFSGIDPEGASAARLTVVYLCGSPYENDYLYFNDNKLNGDDVASSTGYFDLLTFDVSEFLEKESTATFDRGDEDYVHPVLAVLTVYSGELKEDSDLIIRQVTIPELYTDVDNTITANIANTGTGDAFGFSAALYSDGDRVSKAQVSSVGDGENRSVDFIWKPVSSGRHVLTVMADYTDIVSELRENNNNNTPFTVDILDRTPPNITISSPVYGQTITSSNTITVEGSIEESDRNNTILVNGAEALLSGKKWSSTVVLEQGKNRIIVDAIDGSNNTATEFVIVDCDYDEMVSSAPGRSTRTSSNQSNNFTVGTNSSANSVFGGSGTFLSILFVTVFFISIIVVGIRRRT